MQKRLLNIRKNILWLLKVIEVVFRSKGFSVNGTEEQLNDIKKWKKLFEPYGIHEFQMGFAGVDINPLENGKICLIGLSPDSQRYFDHHHSDNDVFEEVKKRIRIRSCC